MLPMAPSPAGAQEMEAAYGEGPEISRGFGLIQLGMTMEEVKEKLKEEPHFNFRGDPDVTMLQRPNESLIETPGYYYVNRAFFQFHEDRLHTIIMLLDTRRIDHYSLFTTFSRSYGPPNDLSPQRSVWEDEITALTLERPLRIKYMDKETYNRIRGESGVPESAEGRLRTFFLEQF